MGDGAAVVAVAVAAAAVAAAVAAVAVVAGVVAVVLLVVLFAVHFHHHIFAMITRARSPKKEFYAEEDAVKWSGGATSKLAKRKR